MDAIKQQMRGMRMSQVVEPDPGQPRRLDQLVERLAEPIGVDRGLLFAGEDQAVILIGRTPLQTFLGLPLLPRPQDSDGRRIKTDGATSRLGLRPFRLSTCFVRLVLAVSVQASVAVQGCSPSTFPIAMAAGASKTQQPFDLGPADPIAPSQPLTRLNVRRVRPAR